MACAFSVPGLELTMVEHTAVSRRSTLATVGQRGAFSPNRDVAAVPIERVLHEQVSVLLLDIDCRWRCDAFLSRQALHKSRTTVTSQGFWPMMINLELWCWSLDLVPSLA